MKIIPAIDLIKGQCVRLQQGDYSKTTIYPQNPIERAQFLETQGYTDLHIVDLDAAKNPSQNQYDFIEKIASSTTLALQVGGGIRDVKAIHRLLNAGIQRVVIGSLAIQAPQQVRAWLKIFGPEKIVLSLDIRFKEGLPIVCTSAWTQESSLTLWHTLSLYPTVQHILCTDIQCDGMLQGPNMTLYQEAMERYPAMAWQASGGIRGSRDIDALNRLGISAAIVGKALYESELKPC